MEQASRHSGTQTLWSNAGQIWKFRAIASADDALFRDLVDGDGAAILSDFIAVVDSSLPPYT